MRPLQQIEIVLDSSYEARIMWCHKRDRNSAVKSYGNATKFQFLPHATASSKAIAANHFSFRFTLQSTKVFAAIQNLFGRRQRMPAKNRAKQHRLERMVPTVFCWEKL